MRKHKTTICVQLRLHADVVMHVTADVVSHADILQLNSWTDRSADW